MTVTAYKTVDLELTMSKLQRPKNHGPPPLAYTLVHRLRRGEALEIATACRIERGRDGRSLVIRTASASAVSFDIESHTPPR